MTRWREIRPDGRNYDPMAMRTRLEELRPDGHGVHIYTHVVIRMCAYVQIQIYTYVHMYTNRDVHVSVDVGPLFLTVLGIWG